MKKYLLENYIRQVLVESKRNNSIKMTYHHLSQDQPREDLLGAQIYNYLRSSNQNIVNYDDRNTTKIVDSIKKAKPNIVNDLEEYCNGYKVVEKLIKEVKLALEKQERQKDEDVVVVDEKLKEANFSVREIDFSPPWLFINLEESVISNRSITYSDPKTKNKIAGAARHNLYFTIKDTNITDVDSLINNIESYWEKRYAVMANLIPLLNRFNEENAIEGIFITQFKTSWPITSKGLFASDVVLEDKMFEADTLKIYMGGVNRNTHNLSTIKEKLYRAVIRIIQQSGLQVVERKRAKFGKDYNKGSFGESTSSYIAKNLINLKKANNKELVGILNSNLDLDVFSEYLDKHIKIIEDYINDPENSAKIR